MLFLLFPECCLVFMSKICCDSVYNERVPPKVIFPDVLWRSWPESVELEGKGVEGVTWSTVSEMRLNSGFVLARLLLVFFFQQFALFFGFTDGLGKKLFDTPTTLGNLLTGSLL